MRKTNGPSLKGRSSLSRTLRERPPGDGWGQAWRRPSTPRTSLAEEGIEYACDWVNDDQPYPMKVKTGSLISIPYTLEINDIPIYLIQNHSSPEIFERSRDQFDTLYQEGAESARIMAISTHPYITGVPHRIRYYDRIFEYIKGHQGVLFMTGSEILDWYREVAP